MKYVLPDTNILINNPGIVKKLIEKNIYVVIPVTIINELDNLKIRKDIGFKVRETGRIIEEILKQKNKHLILTNNNKQDPVLSTNKADDRILATALHYKDKGKKVALLTNDRFLRLKASGLGIHVTNLHEQLIAVAKTSPPVGPLHMDNKADSLSAGNDAYIIITSPIHLYRNRQLDFKVEGFNEKYLSRVRQIKPGDRFVYYVAGDKLFAAITEITSRIYVDKTQHWPDEPEARLYHCFKMVPRIVLRSTQVLSAHKLVPKLSFIRNKAKWGSYFQGSIKRIPRVDYELVEQEMKNIVRK